MKRVRQLWISTRRGIESLVSPARQEIVDCVSTGGPLAVAEIGAFLGRPADSIYYHVRTLIRVGLLVKVGSRRSGTRDESLYDVPADQLLLEYRPDDGKNVKLITKVIASLTRVAYRDFAGGFSGNLARVKGRTRNLWAARSVGWLTRKEIAEINTALRSINRIMSSGKPGRGRELCALSFVLAPRQPRARVRTDGPEAS